MESLKNPKQATFNAARSAFLADRAKKDLLRELRKEFGMEDKVSIVIKLILLKVDNVVVIIDIRWSWRS